MKCENLFFGKNKINIINLSSAEFAQRLVKVEIVGCYGLADTQGTQIVNSHIRLLWGNTKS